MLPQVRRARSGALPLARLTRTHHASRCLLTHISILIFSVYIRVQTASRVCCYVGFLVVFVKINNIPAVFNIPASHALLLTASGTMLPLDLLEKVHSHQLFSSLRLLRMSPARPSFSLANILFSSCSLFAFL